MENKIDDDDYEIKFGNVNNKVKHGVMTKNGWGRENEIKCLPIMIDIKDNFRFASLFDDYSESESSSVSELSEESEATSMTLSSDSDDDESSISSNDGDETSFPRPRKIQKNICRPCGPLRHRRPSINQNQMQNETN